MPLQVRNDEPTGALKVFADEEEIDDNLVTRQMKRLRRKLKFYCWATRITTVLLFLVLTIFLILVSWLLCCQVQRDNAKQQLAEAYLQLKRWAELLELSIHRMGPNLEIENFKKILAHPKLAESPKSSFQKVLESNVKTKACPIGIMQETFNRPVTETQRCRYLCANSRLCMWTHSESLSIYLVKSTDSRNLRDQNDCHSIVLM